jgi:hypothetical protein
VVCREFVFEIGKPSFQLSLPAFTQLVAPAIATVVFLQSLVRVLTFEFCEVGSVLLLLLQDKSVAQLDDFPGRGFVFCTQRVPSRAHCFHTAAK